MKTQIAFDKHRQLEYFVIQLQVDVQYSERNDTKTWL